MELPERRSLPKGNSQDPNTHHAQKWARVHQGIARIREFVEQNPKEKLTTLLYHINEDSLKVSYFALKRDASPGVDGTTWEAYNADRDTRIADLCTRVHRGTFRATPSRWVNIPKPDGGARPLGIAALEDKIVQHAMVKCILAPIYETEFCGFSYGSRPGGGAHDALDALAYVIERRKVNYVVDADIRKFFDEVDQAWLIRIFLEAHATVASNAWTRAVYYTSVRWDKLTRFLGRGEVEIDNNLIENRIRPVGLGRKTYLFADPHAAAQRAAILYSILNTCTLHEVNPAEWLVDVKKTHRHDGQRSALHAVAPSLEGRTIARKSRTDQSSGGPLTSEKTHNHKPCERKGRPSYEQDA